MFLVSGLDRCKTKLLQKKQFNVDSRGVTIYVPWICKMLSYKFKNTDEDFYLADGNESTGVNRTNFKGEEDEY